METDRTLVALFVALTIVASVGIIECNSMERTKAEMRAKCAEHTDTAEELSLCADGSPAFEATVRGSSVEVGAQGEHE